MSSLRRTITAFFPFIFLFSINVVISNFIECMPVESRFPPPFPQILCVCVCGGGGLCVCVCVGGGGGCVCVCGGGGVVCVCVWGGGAIACLCM